MDWCFTLYCVCFQAKHIMPGQNPATWMLEVIGAGTSSNTGSITDYHEFYRASSLCDANLREVDDMIHPTDEGEDELDQQVVDSKGCVPTIRKPSSSKRSKHKVGAAGASVAHHKVEKQPYHIQFRMLCKKIFICYWRTPNYNLVRFLINIIIALVFGSAYAQQEYTTFVGAISRSAVIYITLLFCGVVGMQTVVPVTFAERPAFYREQQSEMYSVALYTLVTTLVEVTKI
jgi:hypothetical protein